MSRLGTGVRYSYATGLVKLFVVLLTVIVMARLLTPTDFGLVALAMPFVALATIFATAGYGEYLLRVPDSASSESSTVFWVAQGSAAASYLILVLIADFIAGHFRLDALSAIIRVSGLTVVFTAVALTHLALARRNFRQDITARAEITSTVAGFVVGVLFALAEASYWALVAIPVTRAFLLSMIIWLTYDWRPDWALPEKQEALGVLKFSGLILLAGLFTAAGQQLDKLLLGNHFAASDVGYYAFAFSLIMVPMVQLTTPLAGIAMPYLTEAKSNSELQLGLSKILGLVALVMMPVLWLSEVSDVLTVAVFGEKWFPSSEIVRQLGYGGFAFAMLFPFSWLLLARGQQTSFTRWSVFYAVLLVIGFYLVQEQGGVAVANVHVAVAVLGFLVYPALASYLTRTSTIAVYVVMMKLAAIAIAAAAITHYLCPLIAELPVWSYLGLSLCVFLIVQGLGFWLLMRRYYFAGTASSFASR